MSDALPVPAGKNDVLVAALAQAAAALQAARGGAAAVDRDSMKECAREVLNETFRRLGYDLDSVESVNELHADLRHAQKSRRSWDKATGTALGYIVTAIVGVVLLALVKYAASGAWK